MPCISEGKSLEAGLLSVYMYPDLNPQVKIHDPNNKNTAAEMRLDSIV